MVFTHEWSKWWAITPTEPFWGLALGWRDYIDVKTHESKTELVVADFTHRYFAFPTYYGSGREQIKNTIKRNLTDSRNPNDFSLVWLHAKRTLLIGKLELKYKLCSYNTLNNEASADLFMDIEDLDDLLDTRKGRFSGEGLRWEMPTFTSFTEKIKHLEAICKRDFK